DKKARKLGQQIAQTLKDKKAEQDSIFHYLNRKVTYSGSKVPFTQAGDQAVLDGQPSNQAAINQTLVAMLQGAGIDAHPLLISTRKSGRINRSFPSFFQFNGQLVYSQINGKSYFMDASFAHSQPNLIPVNTFNETGLLLKSNSYRWVNIKPTRSAYSIQVNMHAKLDRQGNLSGTMVARNAGYSAQKIRQKQAEEEPNPLIIKQGILDGYSKVQVSDASIKKATGRGDSSVKISSNFDIKNYAVSYRSGLQFRPMVVGYLKSNPFSDSTRTLPITLDAPEHLNLSYHIQLPDGMKLKTIPQDHTIQLPGAILQERYDMNGSTLHYEIHINIYHKDFPADLYPQLLNFYQRWVQLSHEQWFVEQ
ncbi:MAG TPA: hypothetical protein VE868_07125, partial [Balneolaceae bacterium]|nr:hypothetical protein [Balneolaceae bacterium]